MYRIFKHYMPRSLIIVAAAELLILIVSVYIAAAFNSYHLGVGSNNVPELGSRALLFSGLMAVVMITMGLYQRDLDRADRKTLIHRIVGSFLIGFALMSLVFYLLPSMSLSWEILTAAMACSAVGVLSCRFLYMEDVESQLRCRVLVLGAGEKARLIEKLRGNAVRQGIEIAGFAAVEKGEPRVGSRRIVEVGPSLRAYVRDQKIDEIVVALDDRRKNVPLQEILDCKMDGIRILEFDNFYERQVGKIKLATLQPSQLVYSDDFKPTTLASTGKRAFDIVVSATILMVAWPIMALTALAILIESKAKGPVIYRQTRVGMNGQHFQVLKFRSMEVDAERNGAQWASENDDRITGVGRFIRKTRIDELPQLFNVLKGEMSFVGPRPERPEFVEELIDDIPYYDLRHYVKPGITGWAQISYSYGASTEDSLQKLQYDLYYLKNYSLFLDLMILLETVQVILWGKGAR